MAIIDEKPYSWTGEQLKDLARRINSKEAKTIIGTGAPTTATVAENIGQQYQDSQNKDWYFCSAITAQGTTPETYTYTWEKIGDAPLSGEGAPDETTEGELGQIYVDNSTGDVYILTGVDDTTEPETYTWEPLATGDVPAVATLYAQQPDPVDLNELEEFIAGLQDNKVGFIYVEGEWHKINRFNVAASTLSGNFVEPTYDTTTGNFRVRNFSFTIDRQTGVFGGSVDSESIKTPPSVVQTTGASTADVMSQKAVTDALSSAKPLTGEGAPTTTTKGELGQTYLDTTTGDLYYLSEIDNTTSPATYTWEPFGAAIADAYTKAESDARFVAKETGKGLSANDFTNADKSKLDGIQAGAEVNVQSDWNEADSTSDSFIQNKPVIPTNTSDLTNDSGYQTASDVETAIESATSDSLTYKGTVANYSGLPASPEVGDMYNITNADATHGVRAGDNVVWTGTTWDVLAGTVDLSNYVEKETGKGLSTNDYTNADKSKLDGVQAGAEANVQSDWNQTSTTADDFIKNKPTIPTKTSDLANDSGYQTASDVANAIDAAVSSVLTYKGTVANYASLPASPEVGDVYNITAADPIHGIEAGDNVAWTGTEWDVLAGTTDLSNYLTKTEAASTYVPQETGKGLSTNDYTNADKSKLDGIQAGAEANVQSDWNQIVSTADDFIKNKPTIPTKTSDLANDSGYITSGTTGNPANLDTDDKTSLVNAINELVSRIETLEAEAVKLRVTTTDPGTDSALEDNTLLGVYDPFN